MIEPGLANAKSVQATPPGPHCAIELTRVSKSYAGQQVLRNFSLAVPSGVVFGLCGPGGSGKTAALRILATLDLPDTGAARITGIDVTQDPKTVRTMVGFMPDTFGSYGPLTVREYLDFYAAGQNVAPAVRRRLCDDLLELVDLVEKQHQSVDSLRPGRKQRLSLARCLIHDPEVLLLDEPAADAEAVDRIELREILKELAKLGKTVLATFRDESQMADIGSHVGIIEAGELVSIGRLEAAPSAPSVPSYVRSTVNLSTGSRLNIRLADPRHLETATQLLGEMAECQVVEVRGDRDLSAKFAGDERDLSGLLDRIAAAGVSVAGFAFESGRDPDGRRGEDTVESNHRESDP